MQQATGPAQAGEANKQAKAAIGRLFAVSEAYPQLRASENFQKLQDELTDTEDKIAAARRYYNQTVYQYNSLLQSFPDLIVAKLGGFNEREFFELEQPADAQPRASSFPAARQRNDARGTGSLQPHPLRDADPLLRAGLRRHRRRGAGHLRRRLRCSSSPASPSPTRSSPGLRTAR